MLKDKFGVCIYNWYGAGGHQGGTPATISGTDLLNSSGKWVSTVRALAGFKLHRAFVDNWIVIREAQPPFTLSTNPTEQNFWFDEFFKLQKANGISNIWSASGCFDWYVPALGGKSQRKSACYDPTKSPTDPIAWADLAELCRQIALRYKDNGLVDYIQILNEWDFRWNVPHVLTPEEYAVGFKVCYEAIRSVAPNQKIMAGCTLTPDMTIAKRFVGQLDTLCSTEGKPYIRDFTYTFNNYIRTQSDNQGSGIGATAEEMDRYGVFYKPLNDFCIEQNIEGWACTETGWNSSPSSSASAMKNKAPALEGFTLEEAQGILAIRMALICASLSKCKGVTFYHCKDGYEAEPFTYHGFNYDNTYGGKPDWSAKPARVLCEAFIAEHGTKTASNFRRSGDYYAVDLSDSTTLVWTDRNIVGLYDAMPKVGTLPTEPNPPNPTVMKIGYSTKSDHSDFREFDSSSVPTVPIWIEAREVTPTVTFTLKKDGVTLKTQNENSAPYDCYGGNSVALAAGVYYLTVKDKNGENTIQFTVGAVSAKEPVLETWVEAGKVYFRTAVKTYSTGVQ